MPGLNSLKIPSSPESIAISLAVVGGTGFLIYKFIKKELKDATNQRKNKKLFEKEIDKNIKASYPPSQFVTWADKIDDAFSDYYFDFTDEDAIYNILRQLKTNNDWLELNKAFGMRTYYDAFSFDYFFGKKANLLTTLQIELDSKEKAKCNAILKSKGIKYRI